MVQPSRLELAVAIRSVIFSMSAAIDGIARDQGETKTDLPWVWALQRNDTKSTRYTKSFAMVPHE
jgi:hypothetical protein